MKHALRLLALTLLFTLFASVAFGETLTLYTGVTVDKDAEYLDLSPVRINDLNRLREKLRLLPKLKKVDMYNSRMNLAQMEALMADFPDIAFGCTFGFIKKGIRTDATAFSTMNSPEDARLPESRIKGLTHCPQLLALDLGHNAIKDLSFLYDAPQLKVLILADNYITDLSPIASLKDLEYLEVFFNRFTDLTPLAGLSKLRDLNLCRNKITDITPLMGLSQLERLWLPDNYLSGEQKAALEAALPNCQIVWEWSRSTSFGWRYHERYTILRRMFETATYEPFPPAKPIY